MLRIKWNEINPSPPQRFHTPQAYFTPAGYFTNPAGIYFVENKSTCFCKCSYFWRRHPDLNWGIEVLQTSALPLGYDATSDSYGIWTHVTAVKGRCLNHLTKEPDSPSRTWTYDSAVNSRVLYRLSYRGILSGVIPWKPHTLYHISLNFASTF